MEEVDKSAVSWLHGLQEFFRFLGDEKSSNHVDFLLKLLYANNPMISLTDEADILEFIFILKKFTENPIFYVFHKYYREVDNPSLIKDAYSRGQVQSKIWLVEELYKIQPNYKNVLVLAGWYGQILQYFKDITFEKARIVDIDSVACLISDDIFNLTFIQDYRVKAVCVDITKLEFFKSGYELEIQNFKNPLISHFKEKFLPDLIINTSAEHMDDEWFHQIKFKELESDPIVAIQSNNLFDVEEHVNCVHSIDHMKKKFPMREVLFEGELQLKKYKRVMLIGRP